MGYKISLEGQLRNGYTNIGRGNQNFTNLPENTNYVPGHFGNLDPIIENDSCEEIIFNVPLNVVSLHDLPKLIMHWATKLQKDGILKVFFININKVARTIYEEGAGIEDSNNIIFGSNREFNSVLDLDTVKSVCVKCKLKPLSINTNNSTIACALELQK